MQNWTSNGAAIDPADARPWYAIYTRHQHEKAVGDLLVKKGFEVFLPLYQSTRRWKDRRKILSLPLFPSYVFIHGEIDRQLQIRTTPGVYSIVSTAGRVAVIPGDEIDAVKRMVENSLRVEPHPFLKCGDRVRVISGPLQGIEGVLTRIKNLFRLVVSVEMLQKSVAVEVEASIVERVSSASGLPASGTDPGTGSPGALPRSGISTVTPVRGWQQAHRGLNPAL
jgi:transcription antitermination factor NusG